MNIATATVLEDEEGRFFLNGVLLLAACGFVLRAWGLSPHQLSADDVAVAVSAVGYMERGHFGTMWHHPELRNILVYLSMSVAGAWGLKAVSLILGSLSVPLVALVSRRILKNESASLMAAFFLAADPLHIDFSRQAVHEVYVMFFVLLGIFLSLRFKDGRKPVFLLLGCASFGLGVASKWDVAFPMAITFLYLLYHIMRKPADDGRLKYHSAVLLAAAFLLVPATVYILTFVPLFQRGFTMPEWVTLQLAMLREASTHEGGSPYVIETLEHHAYLWFIKPVAHADFTYGEEGPRVLLGMGNPLVWLLTIPAVLYVAVKAFKERASQNFFLAGLFCFSYFPFVLVRRPIWVHSAISVLPFAFMAVAYFLTDIAGSKPARRRLLLLYLALVVIAAVPLYILATGKGFHVPLFKPLFEQYRPSFER